MDLEQLSKKIILKQNVDFRDKLKFHFLVSHEIFFLQIFPKLIFFKNELSDFFFQNEIKVKERISQKIESHLMLWPN